MGLTDLSLLDFPFFHSPLCIIENSLGNQQENHHFLVFPHFIGAHYFLEDSFHSAIAHSFPKGKRSYVRSNANKENMCSMFG